MEFRTATAVGVADALDALDVDALGGILALNDAAHWWAHQHPGVPRLVAAQQAYHDACQHACDNSPVRTAPLALRGHLVARAGALATVLRSFGAASLALCPAVDMYGPCRVPLTSRGECFTHPAAHHGRAVPPRTTPVD